MFTIILKQTRHHAGLWGGVLAIMVASGFVISSAFSLIEGGAAGGADAALLGALGAVVVLFAIISVLVIASTAVDYAVIAQSPSIARFSIVGMTAPMTKRVIRGQLAIVTIVGAIFGHAIAALTRQPILESLYQSLVDSGAVVGGPTQFPELGLSPVGAVLVVATMVLLGMLSARKGMKRATTVSPLAILREPEATASRMGWSRWIVAAALLMAVVLAAATIPTSGPEQQPMLLLIPLLLTSLVAALGPVIAPLVAAAATGIGPNRSSVSWHLARQELLYRSATTTASVVPMFVIVSLTMGLYTAVSALTVALGGTVEAALPLGSAILLLGGPALIATVGSIASTLTAGRERSARLASLRALGATRSAVIRSSALQAVFLAATAGVLSVVVSVATALAMMVGLSSSGAQPEFRLELGQGFVILAVSLALLLATFACQALSAYSRKETRSLVE